MPDPNFLSQHCPLCPWIKECNSGGLVLHFLSQHCPNLARDCDAAAADGFHSAQSAQSADVPAVKVLPCVVCGLRIELPPQYAHLPYVMCASHFEDHGPEILHAAWNAYGHAYHARSAEIAALQGSNRALSASFLGLEARMKKELCKDNALIHKQLGCILALKRKLRSRILAEIAAALILAALFGLALLVT